MNFEAVLNYSTLHNQAIIQWLVVVILGLVGALIALALFGRGGESAHASHAALPDAGELTETLKKLMAQRPAPAAAAAEETAAHATPAAGEAAPADALARVRALETELTQRDEVIAQLRSDKPAAATAADPALGARLQELEAKLSEYEILEDDIADLSLYKEENTRLRSELEALKSSGAPAPAADAAPAEPAPVVAAAADAAAEEAAPSDTPETTQPARTAEAAAEAAASFAAFEAAATPAPAPAANEPIPRDLNAEADDLFAEFATALEESGVDLSAEPAPAKTSA